MENNTFKVALVGDGGVGKSCYLKQLMSGQFERKYVPTVGVEIHSVKVSTNYGDITLNMWDMAGQEKFGGLRDGYLNSSDAALVFYDVTCALTYRHVNYWKDCVHKVCCGVPIVTCGNKIDDVSHTVVHSKTQNALISVKDKTELYKPLLCLCQALTKKSDLELKWE
jgi:GTP-binding nuclear protein Ran